MIKQLQKNQLAITDNSRRNSHANTEGFDKMDEVKRFRSDHKKQYIRLNTRITKASRGKQ